jgi:hypothetical protein
VSLLIPYRYYPATNGALLPTVFFNLLIGDSISKKQVPVQAIVDSGAARCIFDARLAKIIGLDLKKGEPSAAQGLGGLVEI